MRRLLLAAPPLLVAAGCTTDSADYKNQTQDYLDDSSAVEQVYDGADVSGAECEAPADTEVGTRYVCTAEVEGVGTVTFDAEIDGENSYVVAPRPLIDAWCGDCTGINAHIADPHHLRECRRLEPRTRR